MGTRLMWASAVLFIAARSAAAQTATPAPPLPRPPDLTPVERVLGAMRTAFAAPVHPLFDGVASRDRLGFGIEYDVPRGRWRTSTRGIFAPGGNWLAEVRSDFSAQGAELVGYGRLREMTGLSFYGPGAASDELARARFRLQDPVAGAFVRARLRSWLEIGGRVEAIWPEAGPGGAAGRASIEERFDSRAAPGLGAARTRFGHYEALTEVRTPAGVGESLLQGGRYRARYGIFTDQTSDRYSFHRVELELQQRLATGLPRHRLTLSGWLSTSGTRAGQDVPFYLQQTLGGRPIEPTVDDHRLGTDGTQATLRGFSSQRFRDRHLVLLQAEYRIPVWTLVDVTTFVDAGTVAARRQDLGFSGFRSSVGFSVNLMRGADAALRADVGFSEEGHRVFVTLGERFLP